MLRCRIFTCSATSLRSSRYTDFGKPPPKTTVRYGVLIGGFCYCTDMNSKLTPSFHQRIKSIKFATVQRISRYRLALLNFIACGSFCVSTCAIFCFVPQTIFISSLDIFAFGNPFEIFHAIIMFIAVFMVDCCALKISLQKCFGNEPVNKSAVSFSVNFQMNYQIAAVNRTRLQDAFSWPFCLCWIFRLNAQVPCRLRRMRLLSMLCFSISFCALPQKQHGIASYPLLEDLRFSYGAASPLVFGWRLSRHQSYSAPTVSPANLQDTPNFRVHEVFPS